MIIILIWKHKYLMELFRVFLKGFGAVHLFVHLSTHFKQMFVDKMQTVQYKVKCYTNSIQVVYDKRKNQNHFKGQKSKAKLTRDINEHFWSAYLINLRQ